MGHFIDLDSWPRRSIYQFFLGFDDPWFNLSTDLDVTATRAACRQHGVSFSLACWFAVLSAAGEVPALLMRLRDGGVWQHDALRVGTTALKADQTFVYAYLDASDDLATFVRSATAELQQRLQQDGLVTEDGDDDLIHGTVIPWVHFTSIKHAWTGTSDDSIPKVALGRASERGERVVMPVNLQAHHALVDGLHAGQFFAALQRLFDTPELWLAPR